MTNSKVEMKLGNSILSVEGSEEFVSAMVDKYYGDLSSKLAPISTNAAPSVDDVPQDDQIHDSHVGNLSKYENVFDSVDDKLKIIVDVPGSNNAEKTRKTALILLFGKYESGQEAVPSEEIRQACVDQGCFDSTNFAANLKGLKNRVVMNTKVGGGYDVKLTAPGRKDAKSLVELLNSEEL